MNPPLDAPQDLARDMATDGRAEAVEQIGRGSSRFVPDLNVALPWIHSTVSATGSCGNKHEWASHSGHRDCNGTDLAADAKAAQALSRAQRIDSGPQLRKHWV